MQPDTNRYHSTRAGARLRVGRRSSLLLCSAFAIGLSGCGASTLSSPAPPAPPTPATHASPPAPQGLPPAPSAVPALGPECVAQLAVAPPSTPRTCPGTGAPFVTALAGALGQSDPTERDAALANLEACESEAPYLRALRAELAPSGCADAWVGPWLETWTTREHAPDAYSTLVGLGLAARLDRLVREAPRLEAPFDEPQFREFLRTTLAGWIAAQAHAIHQTALEGAKLDGYGKGVVAIAAGLADLRFVDVVRDVPLPESLAADAELREEYYLALEQSLEPRVVRGRDAALVGLRRFAALGILKDSRLEQARSLLSRLFAGRRIDALDGLALPPLDAPTLDSRDRQLAAKLPAFYEARWLNQLPLADVGNLRALMERGVSPDALEAAEEATSDPELLRLVFRSHMALGQRYWQAASFANASRVAGRIPANSRYYSEARLVQAIARALHGGPTDAAQMMARGPFLPQSVGDVTELDQLSNSGAPTSPHATFDAALILSLVPQDASASAYWADVAKRFERAASQAPETELAHEAKARSNAAQAIGEAIADLQRQGSAAPDTSAMPAHDRTKTGHGEPRSGGVGGPSGHSSRTPKH